MATWTQMGDVPNPIIVDAAGTAGSGYVLKAFLPGSTTSTSIAIAADGSSPQASLTANADGIWEVSGNEVIPFIDREHKWGIFANATDAAANTPFYMGPFDVVPSVGSITDDLANNTDPAKGSSLVGHILNAIGAVSAFAWNVKDAINHLFDIRVSVTDPRFGATGDGVTDDTAAIQLAIDSAEAIYFPAGDYLTVPDGFSHTSNSWFLTLRVPANRRLYGPGRLLTSAVFSNKTQVLSLLGSNIEIDGLTIKNTVGDGTQPFSIGIGFATSRDDSIAVADYENIRVRNYTSDRNFLATSFFFDPDDSAATCKDVVTESCTAYGHPFTTGSSGTGAFDYHFTTDCSYFNNHSFGATFASAYNMVGVVRGAITGNYAKDNEFAGIEIENGTEDIVVSGNTIINCTRGIWVDDSANIAVTGNTLQGGALGSNGIYITHEGFTDNTSYVTNDIVVEGNSLKDCVIRTTTFGAGGGGSIGAVNIGGNRVNATAITDSCIRLTVGLKYVVNGNSCTGGTDATISINTQAGQSTIVSNNITDDNGDGGDGIDIVSGAGIRLITGNIMENPTASISGTQTSNYLNGALLNDIVAGFTRAFGSGTPEGVVTATAGAIYQRSDGFGGLSLYVKESNSGDTGWVAK